MIQSILVFSFSLYFVIRGAVLATKYSAKLAENFHLSKYIVGFIVVAFISILPETLISINSAIQGMPSFGLGTLFGSNVADLTLIFAILTICAGRGIKIESKVLKDIHSYPLFLFLPILLGVDGYYSRFDGTILIVAGIFFYYNIFKEGLEASAILHGGSNRYKNLFFLFLGMVFLLVGSHFTVISATALAYSFAVSPILIGMLVVGLGTTIPELSFSLKSMKRNDDGLAVGDILGTVLADATIVVGILAFISPFYFPIKIIYIAGICMVGASLLLLKFMHSGRVVSKKEGYLLLVFWACYAIAEFVANKWSR